MKKLSALILALLMAMTTFAGCGVVNVTVDGDSINEADTDEIPTVLSIDAFNDAEGNCYEIECKENGFAITISSLDIYVSETGKTIAETFAEDGFEDLKLPQESNENFEGWMEYKVTVKYDEVNCEYYTYDRANDKLYTTEEILSLTMPEHSVAFIAKWTDTPQKDYDYLENIE